MLEKNNKMWLKQLLIYSLTYSFGSELLYIYNISFQAIELLLILQITLSFLIQKMVKY